MAGAEILFIVGSDRADQIRISGNRFTMTGATDLYQLLGPDVPFNRLQVTPNLFRSGRLPELDSYHFLLNLITEPEQNAKVLEIVRKLVRGAPGKVVNSPEAVRRSTRDQVARRLSGVAGLIVPKTIRLRENGRGSATRTLEQAKLDYPVILRHAGTHTGNIVGVMADLAEVRAALGEAGDYIATEFVDFSSADGLYRKFRVFFIGEQLIFRHMLIADDWNVHAKHRAEYMAKHQELVDEEALRFRQPVGGLPPSVVTTLRAIKERMNLDFFGIDFALMETGEALLFEANATMNFINFPDGEQFAYLRGCIAPATNALRDLVGLESI